MSASLASIFVVCFFRGGGASSIGSPLLSQSSNPVRDTFEHAPESTDAASVVNVLINGTDAAESGGESSGADASGGVCECAVAVADEANSRSHICGTGWSRPHSCRTDSSIVGGGRGSGVKASRITIMHGKSSLGARSNPHPPTG